MSAADTSTKLLAAIDLAERLNHAINELGTCAELEHDTDWVVEAQALNLGDFIEFMRGKGVDVVSTAKGGAGAMAAFLVEAEDADVPG